MIVKSRVGHSQYRPGPGPRSVWPTTSLFILLLTCSAATTSTAAEFSIGSQIQVGPRFDSNPRYESSNRNPDSAWGTLVDARLPLLYRTQRAEISLEPRLVYSFYSASDDDDLENRDKYLTGSGYWSTRLSSTGASYGYTDVALRTSEFQDDGAGGGTQLGAQDTQQRWYFRPNWSYQLSPVNIVRLDGGYEEVHYDEERLVSRRFDYDYTNASASFQHALNERHAVTLRAQFTQFDSENTAAGSRNESKTNSLNLIYTYSWSDRTELAANFGWARTKSEGLLFNIIPFDSDSTNFVGDLTATHRSETVEYKVILGQSITPNSNGSEVVRFNIDASARKQFSERFSGQLGIVAFNQRNVGDANQNFDRNYVRGNVRLNYRFTRRWSIYGAYSYTFNNERRLVFDDRTVRNHFASMGIRFNGDGWRW